MPIDCYGAVDDPWNFDDLTPNDIRAGWDGIVIELGSGSIKAGWCHEESPSKIFPPVVAYDKDKNIIIGNDIEKYETENKNLTNKHYVIEKGKITNFDEIMEILKYIVKDIDGDLLECMGIMIAMSAEQESKEYYKKLADLMYDQLDIWGLQIVTTSTLGLYASGRTTGIVIDCGYSMTRIIAIYEGYALKHYGMNDIEFGRKDFIDKRMDDDEKCSDHMINELKLAELCLNKIIKIWKDTKNESEPLIFNEIIIMGGNAQYKGFGEKFEEKFKVLLAENKEGLTNDGKFKIICPEGSGLYSWVGGASLSCMMTFATNYLDKRRYEHPQNGEDYLWIC